MQGKREKDFSTRFKAGQSGNPGGRPKGSYKRLPVHFRRPSPECLARVADAFFYQGVGALRELASDPSMTPVEKVFIAVMIRASEKGDQNALNMILDRFLGKVKENVEVKTVQTDINDFRSLTDEEILRRRELLLSAGK